LKAEQYQRAKSVFQELVDLPNHERIAQLERLRKEDRELAEEVESLLHYHTAQSLAGPSLSAPRVRTRSTLSTTYQVRSDRWLPAIVWLLGLAFAVFGGIWLLNQLMNQRLQQIVQDRVSRELQAEVENRLREFRQWEKSELERAITWCRDPLIVQEIKGLIEAVPKDANSPSEVAERLLEANGSKRLCDRLQELADVPVQFIVWDRRMVKLAEVHTESTAVEELGAFVSPEDAAVLAPVLKGGAKLLIQNATTSGTHSCCEQISAVVPVSDSDGHTIAACMLLGYGLQQRYHAMLEHWSQQSPGEVYLVNNRGLMCSPSQYGDRLRELTIVRQGTAGGDGVALRDPGVNLLRDTPSTSSSTWPPTVLARELSTGCDGCQLRGYRNYVGQQVVGAWRWVPECGLGIAVEHSYHDAYCLQTMVRRPLLIVSNLLGTVVVGVVVLTTLADFRRRKLRDISEVGPYQILEVLGEGGMGRVFLAEHALLCRQSAVKVLTKGDNDLSVLSRFEREVQLASQLTHPNTIAIYDFGRNRDGVFYYAMEYIDGAHLGQLVEYCGPLEPGRCIFILQQLCRALAEAHQAGVVHRDIKPQNIMVCNRGGEPDFVKLFDYGLVKAFAPGVSESNLQTQVVVGTPRFMAPERLDSPWLADPRVDVYSVGAVAYFLLTGKLPPLVVASGQFDSEQPGIETLDLPPAVVSFGGMLSHCLSVEPAARPSNMSSLLRELELLAEKFPWSRNDSQQWWQRHSEKLLQQVKKKRKQLGPGGSQNA
jgi:eukaryotic-like serine/threonine-protein kinase